MSTKLAHQTQKTAGIPNGMRTATVAAVSDTSITISVSGGTFTAGVGVITSYAPMVGDTVAVFRQDSSWLILGPTAPRNGWNAMADLGYQNGWVDRGPGFSIGQWRETADTVELVGQLSNPAVAANTIVAGLPPSPGEVVMVIAGSGGSRPRLAVNSSGTLSVFDVTAGAGILQFCCAYPRDFRMA